MFKKLRLLLEVGFIYACLIMLSGFLLAVGPDPITLTLNQGTIQDGKVTVNGTFVGSLEGRLLILAVYDTEGKMTDLTSIISVDEAGNWSKELDANSFISGLKAFLLDTSVKPVIDAQGLHRSAMILKIASAGTYSGYYEEVQVLPSVTGQVVFEDMQVRGNLTIAAAQQVIFKGNSMVTGSLKLQKAIGLPTEVIFLDNSRVNTLENSGAAGAIIMSLTETQTTLPTILATENLQLINTSASTVNLTAGQTQNLKLGLSVGTIEQCNIIAKTGATPSGVTLSVQVAGFINPVTRLQTEIETQNLETDEYWLGEGESVKQLTAEIPLTTLGISQWGTVSTSALFNSDASAVIQSLTSSANVVMNGELVYGKGVKTPGKDAPDFTLLGSGTTTLTGTIDVLTLGGTVTGVLSDDNGIAYSVGSVVLQSEATVNPLSNQLNLLNLPSWAPSFTAMPGGLFGSLQTTGSGALGNIIFMQGPVTPPPVSFGGGLFIGSLQFGNNSFGNIQFGSGSQLGNLLNQSPFQSTLNFPSGTNSNQLFQNYADTNSGSRITVRIGDDEQQITRNTSIVPISLKVVTYPSRNSWIGQRSEEYLRNMTVELQYRLMNLTTGDMTDPIVRSISVRGNEEFSVTPSEFAQTGSQEVEIKHIPTGLIVKLPVKVYQTGNSVLSMSFADLPNVIRDSVTGNGKLVGGRVRGVFVNGVSFDYPIYDGDGLQIGDGYCTPSTFDKRMSGSIKITAVYKGFSASAYVDIGSSKTWGIGFRESVLEELDDWQTRLNEYIDPDKSQLSRLIDSIKQLVITSTSEGDIVRFMDSFRNQAENLMKTEERVRYNLNMLQILTIKQIKEYWPAKAGGGTYVLTDYSATGLEKIFSVKEYWSSAVEPAENELQINGDTENPGILARAKAEIDAIPRKGDDLNAVLNRFGESPSKTLTRSEGTSVEEQIAIVRDALYREMLLLGGDPTWKLSCVRDSETQYTVTLISSESNSLTKTFTIQWNIWETRGSVLSELYLVLNQSYPTWVVSKPYTEIYSQFADAVNMNDTEKIAFAFFYDQGLLNGRAQGGTQVTMDPGVWITRNQYLQLLSQIEERLLLDLSQSNLPALSSSDELLASGVEDFVKQTNQLFVNAISSRLKLVGQYSELPPQLNDSNVQTILLQGQIDLTAGENSTKNIIVLKNAHLTIFNGFQLAMKDQANLLLLGFLTNNGELHIDPDAQFEMRDGAMLNNTARFVNFGRVLINGVTNPNLYNIEHHSIADRMEVILGLYQRFHEGYGFHTPTTADLELYASRYSDWNQIQSDNPDDIREEAMAWIIFNGAYNGRQVAPESNDFVIEPSLRLNRADMAQMLWQFASTLPSTLTPVTSPATFSDVLETDGHYDAVIGLAAAGIFESNDSDLFRANYLVETTRFNWGSELDGLLNRLVAAAGYAESEISLIRIMPGENPVFRNKNFVNPVSVYSIYHVDFVDNWGGEVRFINCKFSDYLKINLVDINYMVVFENVVLHNNEVYTTTPDPSQMVAWGYTTDTMMPDSYNRDIRVSLNGIPSGTTVLSDVNTEVTLNEVGTFFINGALVQSTGSIQEGQSLSALIWKECEAQHAPDYSGDHSECVRDPNAVIKVPADQYRVLEVRGNVSTVSLPNPDPTNILVNFGRVVMNDDCPENIRLNFGTYDTIPSIFRINGGRVNTLILNGVLSGNLEVVGHTDLRELTVSGNIDIGTWWENTAINIGNHSVRLLGHGDRSIALNADHGAVVLVTESGQPYTINDVSETDHGFQIGLPHVYGDQGNCGVYIGTENTTDYDFVVSQGTWDEENYQMTYNSVTMTEQVFTGENKTHLTPVNQSDITDYNQLALSTTWRNGEKTITVILQQIPIKVNYLNRSGFAMSLYGEFKNIYGLTDAAPDELLFMSTRYSDWNELSADEKTAMAFMLKHQLLTEVAEGELRYVKPQEQVSRGQAAQSLMTLVNAMQQAGTYPNGLNLNIAPNASFNDLPTGDLSTAILNLAKAGVFSTDDSGFRPNEILSDRDLRDWIWRLQQNLGPAVSLDNSFEVLYGQEVRVENKVFSQEVTVFSNREFDISKGLWSPENQGGEIRFINCDFQGGLTLLLGEVGYQVGFDNVQLKDQILYVEQHTTLSPNLYLPEVQIRVHGVPSGTIIDNTVNVSVTSIQVGYFILNGIRVDSALISTQEPPQDWAYQAGITRECYAWHAPNQIVDHANCKQDPNDPNSPPARQFNMMEFNGQIASVTPLVDQVTKYSSIAKYQVRDIKTQVPVELHIQQIQPTLDQLYIQADTNLWSAWNVIGSAACNTEVTGPADLTQFVCQKMIFLNNWYPEEGQAAQILMSGQSVVLTGDNAKDIHITAGQGARINNTNNLKMSLLSSILEQEYDIYNYHVFGEDGNYSVYLDSLLPTSSGTYNIILEKPIRNIAGEITDWVDIPYTPEPFATEFKTHLNPVNPQEIENPWEVRMTVTWISGNETITVIYEFLPYQQPTTLTLDLARVVLENYTTSIGSVITSDYGLALPSDPEMEDYAAQYDDWETMNNDPQQTYPMALLVKNQIIQGTFGTDVNLGKTFINPYQSLNRGQLAEALYALVQKIEQQLGVLENINDNDFYEDILLDHPLYAKIYTLLHKGILPDDWMRFEAEAMATKGDLWDWNDRIQKAVGPINSTITEIVLDGNDQTLSNKTFDHLVTIRNTMTRSSNLALGLNQPENWGGRLEIINCVFQQGLNVVLDQVPYEIAMGNSPVTGDIHILGSSGGMALNQFNSDWNVSINGVAEGTMIVNDVNVSVTCNATDAWFNLNGNLVEGADVLGQNEYFGVNLQWVCDDYETHHDTDNHSACSSDMQRQLLGIHGAVREVQAGINVPLTVQPVHRFELWDTLEDVNLRLPTDVAYPHSNLETIFGGWDSNGHFLRVSGFISNSIAVEGKVDISALQFAEKRDISIAAWREPPTIVIGTHEVTLFGPQESSFNLQVAPQAKIHMWFVGAVPVDLKDMTGFQIPYDVSMVNWSVSPAPDNQNVIVIGSADTSLSYVLYEDGVEIAFSKGFITKDGETEPSLTVIAPTIPIVEITKKYVLEIQRSEISICYTPIKDSGELQTVSTFTELLAASKETNDQGILLAQSISLPVAPVDGWSLELNRHLVIDENATLTIPAGAKMAYKSIECKGYLVVEGSQDPLAGGYLQGGNIIGGINVSGIGEIDVEVDEIGFREALLFETVTNIIVVQPVFLTTTLDLANGQTHSPKSIVLQNRITAQHDQIRIIMYNGDQLVNQVAEGHNFYEIDGITLLPNLYSVTGSMRVFKWNGSDKWITESPEVPYIPM